MFSHAIPRYEPARQFALLQRRHEASEAIRDIMIICLSRRAAAAHFHAHVPAMICAYYFEHAAPIDETAMRRHYARHYATLPFAER